MQIAGLEFYKPELKTEYRRVRSLCMLRGYAYKKNCWERCIGPIKIDPPSCIKYKYIYQMKRIIHEMVCFQKLPKFLRSLFVAALLILLLPFHLAKILNVNVERERQRYRLIEIN